MLALVLVVMITRHRRRLRSLVHAPHGTSYADSVVSISRARSVRSVNFSKIVPVLVHVCVLNCCPLAFLSHCPQDGPSRPALIRDATVLGSGSADSVVGGGSATTATDKAGDESFPETDTFMMKNSILLPGHPARHYGVCLHALLLYTSTLKQIAPRKN